MGRHSVDTSGDDPSCCLVIKYSSFSLAKDCNTLREKLVLFYQYMIHTYNNRWSIMYSLWSQIKLSFDICLKTKLKILRLHYLAHQYSFVILFGPTICLILHVIHLSSLYQSNFIDSLPSCILELVRIYTSAYRISSSRGLFNETLKIARHIEP